MVDAEPASGTTNNQTYSCGRCVTSSGRDHRAAALLEGAAEDVLAFRYMPLKLQRQVQSTDSLDRSNLV